MGTVWSLQPFISQNAHLIPIITGATIVCFSFLGFDAVTTLSEETPDAARVIPKAIFLTAVYGGVIFIAASFFMQLFFPDISRFKDPDAALPEIALYVGGKLFQSIFLCTTFVNTPPQAWLRTPACHGCCTSWAAITFSRSAFSATSIRNGVPRR